MPNPIDFAPITADGANAPAIVFAANATSSNVLDLHGMKLLGVEGLSAFPGDTIKFKVSNKSESDVGLLCDKNGIVAYNITDPGLSINFHPVDLCSWRYVQLVITNTSASIRTMYACARGL